MMARQDKPPENGDHAPGAGRAGRAEIVLAPAPGGRTYLSRQYCAYPFHITRLFYLDHAWPELATLYVSSASGGLFQGDRISLDVTVHSGASAHLTTSSATKVHCMERDYAVQTTNLKVESGAYLEYLAEPTILFPRSSLKSVLRLSVARGSCAIIGDSFLTHDPEGSNRPGFDELFNEVSIFRENELLALDRMRVSGDDDILSIPGLTGARFNQATVYFVYDGKPAETLIHAMREAASLDPDVYAGVSALPGDCGAYARFIADDSLALRKVFMHVWAVCRELSSGRPMTRYPK